MHRLFPFHLCNSLHSEEVKYPQKGLPSDHYSEGDMGIPNVTLGTKLQQQNREAARSYGKGKSHLHLGIWQVSWI